MVDLRTLAQQGTAGGSPGIGIFSTPNATVSLRGYDLIATEDPSLVILNPGQKNVLEMRLGLPQPAVGNTVLDVIWEALTSQADASGVNSAPPILPTDRTLRLHLGAYQASKQFNAQDAEATPVFAHLQEVYRGLRTRTLQGQLPPGHYLKWLGFQVRKLGINYRLLQPVDLPDEAPLEPTTTYTESWNTADSTTLGPDLTWNEIDATFSVVSNSLSYDGNSLHRYARAEHDLSGEDHYVQGVMVEGGSGGAVREAGVLGRVSTSVKSYYAAYVATSSHVKLYKLVSGTATQLGSTTAITFGTSKILKLTCNGSTISVDYDGATMISVTDTAVTGNLRAGVGNFNSSAGTTVRPRLDDFKTADLGGGTTEIPPMSGSGVVVAPSASAPAVGVAPVLTGTGVVVAPSASAPAVGQIAPLTAAGVVVAPSASAPATSEIPPLSGSGSIPLPSGDASGTASITPLTGTGVVVAPSASAPAVGEIPPLIAVGVVVAPSVEGSDVDYTPTLVRIQAVPQAMFVGQVIQQQWMDAMPFTEATFQVTT